MVFHWEVFRGELARIAGAWIARARRRAGSALFLLGLDNLFKFSLKEILDGDLVKACILFNGSVRVSHVKFTVLVNAIADCLIQGGRLGTGEHRRQCLNETLFNLAVYELNVRGLCRV